ncbi:MAG: hypothetical protein RSC10_04970 [Longicatena sp.]
MDNRNKIILLALLFVGSVGLICFGQLHVGYGYLGLQVLGLIGILFVMYCYNKQYK